MTFRDDVREYFERESRRLPAPAGLRADVTAGALERPRPTSTVRWAAVLAALLAVAIVAGLLASSELRKVLNPPVVPGHVHVGAGQTQIFLDVSPIDGLHAYALIVLCGADYITNCQAWVESTADGGRTWGGAVKVGPTFRGSDADTIRHIHFATVADGFVYGLGVAYVTHNAGRTWSQAPSDFSNLVWIAGATAVWELVDPCPAGTVCPIGVRMSVDGGRTWSTAAALPGGLEPQEIVPFGASGLLLGSPGKGDMAITTDGGRTWRSIGGRCSSDSPGNSVATSDGREIWQVCGTQSLGVFVSTDGGVHWTAHQNPGVGNLVGPILISPVPGTALLTTSTTTAGVISDLLVSRDGGASWQLIPAARGFWPPEFTQAGVAWSVDLHGYVWISTDDGLTWVKRSQPSP
ncbi:MAG TPA: sialidase family protein [Candidatus Dormibacteraeota bacterium]|nr:sialidase family protein [Candidatus Dormibacteraeota bacterium]